MLLLPVQVFASYADHHPFNEEELTNSTMEVIFSAGGGESKVRGLDTTGF